MGEFELIQHYFNRQAAARGVSVGIGDDCAVLEMSGQLAVSMDTLVSGVHFPQTALPRLIAERALRCNLSDLAAMGAQPVWFTLALTLPDADERWLEEFASGLFAVADQYGIALVGGDTTRGPLAITIQVHGEVPRGQALLRSGASVGDVVCVTGPVGDGAAALALLNNELNLDDNYRNYLIEHFYRPAPCLIEGRNLRGIASAAIDISDGLAADLGHILSQSQVGARLHLDRLPLSPAVSAAAANDKALNWVLNGGDDYELCFTVPPGKMDLLEQQVLAGKVTAFPVGEITQDDGLVLLLEGRVVNFESGGFQHFE